MIADSDLESLAAPPSDRALDGLRASPATTLGDVSTPARNSFRDNEDDAASRRSTRSFRTSPQRCAILIVAAALIGAVLVFAVALSASLRKPKKVTTPSQQLGMTDGTDGWFTEVPTAVPTYWDDDSDDDDGSPCPSSEGHCLFELLTDAYPAEISWAITSGDSMTIYAEGPPQGTTYESRTSYSEKICLPYGNYNLEMYDEGGDGICCTYFSGKATVTVDGVTAVETGDENYRKKKYPFTVPVEAGDRER